MSQDHTDRPERSETEYAIIRNAKRCLMTFGRVDEPTAHHTLQRAAMGRRVKMPELARWLLEDAPHRVAEILGEQGSPRRPRQPVARLG